MKITSIAVALALVLSVSAAPQNRQGGFGQNNKNAGNKNNNAKGAANNAGGAAANNAAAAGNTKLGANAAGGVTINKNAGAAANNATAASTAANSTATDATGGAAANSTATANTGAAANTGDPQTSTIHRLALDPKVIASGFADDGQDVPAAGQVASLTSTNNFINFCLTVPNLAITNGKQITQGSCNPAPMGAIPSTDAMPSSKFTVPKNGDTLKENTAFTITMAIQNMQTGAFVNAEENYFSAPQQLNAQGQIIGHSHVVVEQLSALDQTTPTDPKKFAFFKGLNAAAANGVLTADVTSGLPAGVYKLSSINTAANHQPVLVPIAQHGSLDDAVYFTITADGNAAAGAAGAAGAANSTAAAGGAAAASSTDAAAAAASTTAAAGGIVADGAAGGVKAPPAAASSAAASKGIVADGAAGGAQAGNKNTGAQAANNKGAAGGKAAAGNNNAKGGNGGRNNRRMSRMRL
ncbi:hypothetical protein BD779DRAFT_1470556 [Infundibulicybe gibba]|nr:hypothetical protein BD779DRAFT_1470556 [Infundibulicybe gibba]